MRISKKILSMIMVFLLIVGMVPISAIAADTGETYTLTIEYAITSSNGVEIGDDIADEQITNIPPNTMIDLSEHWTEKLSVIGADGETYYFGGFVENSDGDGTPVHFWKIDGNKTLYAGWTFDSQVSISLDTNGGALDCKAIRYPTKFANIDRMNDKFVPVRDGYRFLGWSLANDGTADNPDNTDISANCTLYAVWEEVHSHCVCGGNTDIGDHTTHTSNQNWQPTDTLPTTAGYYYLTSDITLTESWKPVDGIYLCLNGKVIRQTVANQNAIAFEEEYASLTLTDCSTEKHKFSVGDDGVWELDANGDKELTGGVITGTNGLSAVFVNSRSKLNIYNVNIVGNKCTNGGGILTRYICNLYDVTVVGNSASYAGGGIRADSATLSIYGGKISHNTSLGTGGGIEHSYGELLMDGTLISKNTSMETGGGIWNEGILTIKGGNITDNSSKNSTGGGVWNHSTRTPAISGDTIITGNTGKGEVNNLHLASDGTVDAKIAVGTMGTNASVGVSVDSNHGMIISSGGKDYADKFFSDNGDYAIAVDGEDLELLEKTVQVGMVTLGNGEYTTDGENIDTGKPTGEGYAYFRDGVLTLNNFTYSGGSAHSNPAIGSDLAAIFCEHDLTIKVEGRNSITRVVTDADTEKDKTLRGIWNDGDLKIVGDSREDILKVAVSGHNGALANAVESINESIFIDNCTLEAKSVTGGFALIGYKAITITKSKVVASTGTADDRRSTFGIYTVTLTVTDSDVIGIAENNAVGKANGIHMAEKDAKLIFESGSIIGRTSDVSDESYAVYVDTGNVTLPTKYWMRTSASGEYVNGTWDGANVGPYFELTTVEPHTHNYTYSVNGYTITESCTCGHTATTEIERDYNGTAIYNGSAYGAKVVYSEKWIGDKVTELKYYKEQRTDGNLVTECIDAGDYFAVLTVEGVTAEWFFSISQKEPVISIKPTVSNIVVNSTLSDISLNGGTVLGIGDAELEGKFSWKEPTAVMGTVGPQTVKVVFTPNDKNYSDRIFDLEVNVVNCATDSGEHEFTEWQNSDNEHWLVCAKCKAEKTGSREAHKGGTATCTAKAKCSECGEEYGDFGEHNWDTNWTTDSDKHWHKCLTNGCTVIKDDNAHSGGTATCKDQASCEICNLPYGKLGAHGKTEIKNAKDATCTTDGYTGDTYCKVCNQKIVGGDKIAATGHLNKETRNKKDATCTQNGNTGDIWCKDCNTKLEKGTVIAAIGHNYENGKCKACGTADPNYKPTTNPSDNSKSPQTGDNSKSPQTSDNSNVVLWLALLFVSGMGIVATTVVRRKKRMN